MSEKEGCTFLLSFLS